MRSDFEKRVQRILTSSEWIHEKENEIWPLLSLDLNPGEQLGTFLSDVLNSALHHPTQNTQLMDYLSEE